ncbi:TetR/AcrR family transcriptional regulator [Krasilnikoviella flava]|uniref:Transcriptional regulator, TetR family n=1 Tax=Krasilnikoviella flava TaxID=526729 RepID=A0A1T5JZJ8_9MICO|nr:helix-turn-helix domain-containing protein [Krasilnikoviella flava]SKC56841.1 transcriptional regulator, TetR family [Krasilnikoviella flava]
MPRDDLENVLDPNPSQLALLTATERLVARHGLQGASSRAIVREAGHRNHSAVTYHFGSRETMLDALYHWRSKPIEAHRSHLVAELVAEGREQDPEALVRAYVVPLVTAVEGLRPSAWARYTQAVLQHRPLVFMDWVRRDVKRYEGVDVPVVGTLDLLDRMRAVTCDGVEPVAALRVAMVSRAVVAAVAAWEADDERGDLDVPPLDVLADQLVRSATGMLAA